MVAKWGNEEQRHWTSIGPEDHEAPLHQMFETLMETSQSFLQEIASGDERAVRSARNIVRTLADTLKPIQLASLLESMLANAASNMANKMQQE